VTEPRVAAPEHLESRGTHTRDADLRDGSRYGEAEEQRSAPSDDGCLARQDANRHADYSGDGHVHAAACRVNLHSVLLGCVLERGAGRCLIDPAQVGRPQLERARLPRALTHSFASGVELRERFTSDGIPRLAFARVERYGELLIRPGVFCVVKVLVQIRACYV
jgi:hypothetical protein